MTEVEFQAGDELDGDLENEGFAGDAGAADENADATAVSHATLRRDTRLQILGCAVQHLLQWNVATPVLTPHSTLTSLCFS